MIEYQTVLSNEYRKNTVMIRLSCCKQMVIKPIQKLIPEEWLHINIENYHSERSNWRTQIKLYLDQWKTWNYNHIVLRLESSILKYKDTYMRDNAIIYIIDSFMAYKGKSPHVIITHPGNNKYDWLIKCVHLSGTIYSARLLAMLPGNVATPKNMVEHFEELFDKIKDVKIKVWNDKELEDDGFNLILGVGNSSTNKPRLITIERKGNKKRNTINKKICIIGKGITFDSGGLSLKPIQYMMNMKYDKIGAIYGAYSLFELMKDPNMDNYTLIGIFPFAENAVSGQAIRPGDVIKSYIGKTVEITDPDAEGRLILADAFGYAQKFKPHMIVDIATLTGAAEQINCYHSGYYYATPEKWKIEIEKGTDKIGERMIAMPTWNNYDSVLDSPVADFANSPNSCSDAFTASLFIKQFVPKNSHWLHIDLSHEIENSVPRGHGIRSIIESVNIWCKMYGNK